MRVGVATILALCAVILFLMPILWMVSSSVRRPREQFEVEGLGIPWLDFEPSFHAWASELANPVVQDGLFRSTVIAVAAMALATLLAVPAAWALAREARYGSKRRSDVITGLLLAARVVPPIALVIPLYLLIDWAGLIDTMAALILVNASLVLPFIIVIMRQTFIELPVELEEAAMLDGAPAWVVLTRIILPVSTPALAASALIALAYVWNDYLFALSFFRLEMRTMPILVTAGGGSAGAMVRTMIAIAVPAIVALVAQRYIVRGLTFGAVSK
ncbi:MAG: carbohydrate ABC transporter permease [Alphaproteobacteria bacterium]